jgi:hypothetical protein
MTAFNVVRVRVKPGREAEFIEAHRTARLDFDGFRRGVLIKTGERTYCVVGEWDSMLALAAVRPAMASFLDRFRDTLEDLGHGLGISDPVMGEAILDSADRMAIPPPRAGADATHGAKTI